LPTSGGSAGLSPAASGSYTLAIRLAQQKTLGRSRFVDLPADQIDDEIEGAQRRICEILNLDRSSLWQVPERDPRSMKSAFGN
jgi:hypothetical protein